MQNVDGGRGCVYVEGESVWQCSVLPTQICCEPKPALRNSLLIINK